MKIIRWLIFLPVMVVLNLVAHALGSMWTDLILFSESTNIILMIFTIPITITAFMLPVMALFMSAMICPNYKAGMSVAFVYSLYTMWSYFQVFEITYSSEQKVDLLALSIPSLFIGLMSILALIDNDTSD